MDNNKATYFLTKVSINEVFHLKDFEIVIDEKELKHLILTGKNGSGKTILMNAILAYLNIYRDFLHNIHQLKPYLEPGPGENLATRTDFIGDDCPIKLYFNKSYQNIIQSEDFILAHYEANRKPSLIEPSVPSKPDLQRNQKIEDKKVDQFLNFLINLKTQEVYARNEGALQGADEIKAWFVNFEDLLKTLFDNPKLKLEFQYQDYSFWINDHNKRFKFTQLSDGYSAIMDIIADLILKMQDTDRLHRTYFKHGIVLIDELETHLHLQLQGKILPMLTKIFPNIQFIVTTHSPFVLNSLPNAVAYDLENNRKLEDLPKYTYEMLAENYFGVKTASSYLTLQYDRFEELINKEKLNNSETIELRDLRKQLDNMDEISAPSIKGAYRQAKLFGKNVTLL